MHPQVAHQLFDPVIGQIAIAAMQLQALVDDARAGLGYKFLGHRAELGGIGMFLVQLPGRLAQEGARRLQLDLHIGQPELQRLKLVEPLRELFKDEVRKIGLELGLPYDMVYRHPFPGPGLGVRILGEVKKEYADTLRLADHIFIEELRAAGLYHKTSQAFAVFLPVKSVGVVGDARRYEYVVALRAVETIDFMTARWAHLPYEFLELVSSRIINEIPGISRVTYDISSKPPATIEWE